MVAGLKLRAAVHEGGEGGDGDGGGGEGGGEGEGGGGAGGGGDGGGGEGAGGMGGGGALPKQMRHPPPFKPSSDFHLMAPLATTPSGPEVPQYLVGTPSAPVTSR